MRTVSTEYVQLTDSEWHGAINHAYSGRFRFARVSAFGGLLLSIVGLTIYFSDGNLLTLFLGMPLLGAGLGDLVYLAFYFRKFRGDPQNAGLFVKAKATIDADRIVIESENGSASTIPWSMVVRVEQLDENYLLYIAKYASLVMLRRAQTPDDWTQFREWAELRKAELGKS